MKHKQTCLTCLLILSLLLCSTTGTAMAEESAPNLWERLRSAVTQEGEQLQDVIAGQQQADADEEVLQKQLEYGRRIRAMHREAVLLSELNVAWISDELNHWDCRIAEQKVIEVETRVRELNDFSQRIDALCGNLSADAGYQQQACERQRTELTRAASELEGLGQRYSKACQSAAGQSKPTGGDQQWR